MTSAAPPPDGTPAPEFDRGISPVRGRLAGRPGRLIGLAALLLGSGVFLAAAWERDGEAGAQRARTTVPPRQFAAFEPARRDPPRLSDASEDPDAPGLIETPLPALETPPSSASAPTRPPEALAHSARRAPVLAYSRPAAGTAPAPAAVPSGSPTALPHALDVLRRTGPIERAAATRLPDLDLTLAAGATVPCVLQTAMDSATPGYVACVLPRDVYSQSGAVVLMERGTRVLGEYRGGLRQGRRRLFVLWTRAVTPSGVAVELASPAADALGRAGFDGAVDTHFWDRFGGAVLLSLIDDGAYAAFGAETDGGALARRPSDAAAAALEGAIDIPPTLRKAQGAEVAIFVARDLDFRGVYRLRAR